MSAQGTWCSLSFNYFHSLPQLCGRHLLLLPCPNGRNRVRVVKTLTGDRVGRRWQSTIFQPGLSVSESFLFPENHGFLKVCDLRMVSLSCFGGFYP